MAKFRLLLFLPVKIEMKLTTQSFESLQFLSANELGRSLMDGVGLGLCRRHFHELGNELIVKIQGGPHGLPSSYAYRVCINCAYVKISFAEIASMPQPFLPRRPAHQHHGAAGD